MKVTVTFKHRNDHTYKINEDGGSSLYSEHCNNSAGGKIVTVRSLTFMLIGTVLRRWENFVMCNIGTQDQHTD
jgi:hypothetical protein